MSDAGGSDHGDDGMCKCCGPCRCCCKGKKPTIEEGLFGVPDEKTGKRKQVRRRTDVLCAIAFWAAAGFFVAITVMSFMGGNHPTRLYKPMDFRGLTCGETNDNW